MLGSNHKAKAALFCYKNIQLKGFESKTVGIYSKMNRSHEILKFSPFFSGFNKRIIKRTNFQKFILKFFVFSQKG